MKKCKYCAEPIQDEAVICRFCGRNLGTGIPFGKMLLTSFVIALIIVCCMNGFKMREQYIKMRSNTDTFMVRARTAFETVRKLIADLREGLAALKDYNSRIKQDQLVPIDVKTEESKDSFSSSHF